MHQKYAHTNRLNMYMSCLEKPHNLLNLGELVSILTEDIDVMRKVMLEKEQKLAALFKKTSKIMSEYEKETEEMVKQLHRARDEQVF